MRDRHTMVMTTLAMACAVVFVLPAGPAALLVALVGLVAAVVALRALIRLPRGRRGTWSLVVAGLLVLVGARLTEAIGLESMGAAPPIGVLLLTDAGGALLIAAGVMTVVGPPRLRDLASSIDALIILGALGTVIGVFVIQPAWGQVGGTLTGALPLLVHPAVHLVLLVATVGLATVAPWEVAATRFLVAGSLGLVLAASAELAHLLGRAPAPMLAPLTEAATMTVLVLLALGVHDRTAHELAIRRAPDRVADAPWRLVVLGAVLLLLPMATLGGARDGTDVAMATTTASLVLLLTARLGLLVRELPGLRAQELAEEQRRGHRRLEALVRNASDATLILGEADRVTYATPAATAVFGADPTGWTSTQLLNRVHPEDRDTTHRVLLESLVHDDERPARFQTRLLAAGATERHVEMVVVDLTTDPDVGGTVLTFQDTSERVELERRLRHLAFHDPLTGLSNREVLQDRLVKALARAARTQRPLAVLLCDLDDFKDVNDTYGHAVGDQLLVAISERLHAAARDADTVARLGGDEFAILCEDIHGHRDAIEIARRMLAATDGTVEIGGRRLRAGVSIGIAVDDGRRSEQDLLRDADIALYEAKADGKQRWSVHRRRMTERAHARLQLASDLGRAVEAGEIEVAFQPIVRLADLQITGVESLARWDHPEHGWVPPAQFIPLAEETGQIVALGDIVLQTALASFGRWLAENPELDLRCGINVSARQVRDPGLPERVAGWLAEHGVDPPRLILELTESVMLDEADNAIEVMGQLRDLGVRFAVDDFGTGYSSLAYLRRLPVDIVKTDRAFVRELGRDEASTDLVRAVVEMARSLRLDVVAEGVEHAEQRDALIEMGCGFGQGYLFSHPVAADVLVARLRQGVETGTDLGQVRRDPRPAPRPLPSW